MYNTQTTTQTQMEATARPVNNIANELITAEEAKTQAEEEVSNMKVESSADNPNVEERAAQPQVKDSNVPVESNANKPKANERRPKKLRRPHQAAANVPASQNVLPGQFFQSSGLERQQPSVVQPLIAAQLHQLVCAPGQQIPSTSSRQIPKLSAADLQQLIDVLGQSIPQQAPSSSFPPLFPPQVQIVQFPAIYVDQYELYSFQNDQVSLPKVPIPNADGSDSTINVNRKQLKRILKRCEDKKKLLKDGKIPMVRTKEKQESRQKHANNRKRGPKGNFE